ncbi:MAG: GHKL domain-containing protein, partial [Candidatus Sericytochromatia bacterium]|nr:GHKL domain-containing protein [Candidatus Sericytochromatia bacterium]
ALPEIEKQGFGDLLDKVYQTGEPEFGYEILAKIDKNKDGNLVEGFYNFVYQPIFDLNKNVEGISVFGFEVTEQVKSREQIDKLYNEVQNSNAQLQNFASIASHDLQAPLRTITSYTQLLFKYSKDKFEPNELEFIDFIQNASKRMQELITNLLEYSKIGIEKNFYISHDLNEIMKIVLSDLQPLINENNVTVSCTDLPCLKTDKIQIIRLFQNIITNSIKYRSSNNPVITISAKKENDYYLFSILDNGIGINEKYYDKIFEIFQRLETDKNVEGTGIGLANCKKIVEQHGGKIWVESVEGEGSTFYFQLPV